MPRLILRKVGGGWEMIVPNTNKAIALKLGEQGVNEDMAVKNLAEAMQQGSGQVVADAEYIFENSAQIDAAFVNNVFASANELAVGEVVEFTAGTGETLLSEMAEAGEALLAAI